MSKKDNLPALTDVKDRYGNRIVVPDWFEGSIHDFAAIIGKLEPHHCSYPSGMIKADHKNMPCMNRKMPGQLYCKDHLGMAVPRMHTDKLSREQQKELGEAIADSNLLDPSVNVFYADTALARQAQKCNQGGLSTRLAKSLNDATATLKKLSDECNRRGDYVGEVRQELKEAEGFKALDPREINRIRDRMAEALNQWQKSYKRLLVMHERFKKIADLAFKDEEHWRELRDFNDHSVSTKDSAVKIMHGRQGFLAIEESRRALFALTEHMQHALIEMVDRRTADIVMNLVYQRFSNPTTTTELTGYRSMEDE